MIIKKTSAIALFLVCGLLGANAQQITNGGFEIWKSACGSSEAFGTGSSSSPVTGEMRQRPGTEPESWNGSNVNQKVVIPATKDGLVSKSEVAFSGVYSTQLKNVFVGAMGIGSVAPGYITFGTPWVYAETDVEKCDGGTYGGIPFTSRPDAITGVYKRVDANEEDSYIIAYLWDGTFKSKVGKAGTPTQERENVERAVLGKITPDESGTLVAVAEKTFRTTNNQWEKITVPFEYKSDENPSMANVIICCGDYYTRKNLVKDTELLVDDVQFVYYSHLKDLKVNEVSLPDFKADKYEYTIDVPYSTDAKIAPVHEGQTSTHDITFDDNNYIAKINVKNDNGNDADGLNEHTYTVQFAQPQKEDPEPVEGTPVKVAGGTFKGTISIYMDEEPTQIENELVVITPTGEGTCDFALNKFTLSGDPEESIGDILVQNVKTTKAEGSNVINYVGSASDIELADGGIIADVELEGTEDADHNMNMDIHVIWKLNQDTRVPIEVKFTGKLDENVGSHVIPINGNNVAPRYYTVDGVEVKNPSAPGIYIVRRDDKTYKIIIK